MKIAERIQSVIHAIEVGRFSRWVQLMALGVAVFALAYFYDLTSYHNFSSPEAMDAAQVGRNIAGGRGFSTAFIRPLSIHLLQKHNQNVASWTNATQVAGLSGSHPDLANVIGPL